jgi:hypothetical protein
MYELNLKNINSGAKIVKNRIIKKIYTVTF